MANNIQYPCFEPVYSSGVQTGWKDGNGNFYNLNRTIVVIPVDKAFREFAERRALEKLVEKLNN